MQFGRPMLNDMPMIMQIENGSRIAILQLLVLENGNSNISVVDRDVSWKFDLQTDFGILKLYQSQNQKYNCDAMASILKKNDMTS